jgi:hypothetical protein
VVVSALRVIAGHTFTGQSRACPPGTQTIAGSCTTDLESPIRDVSMMISGFFSAPGGWGCDFRNNEDTPVTIRVFSLCLVPPP